VNGRGSVTRIGLASLAVSASLALLVSGCTDAIYPAVHDMPTARPNTTLTPDEVKQATDNLILERDHLSTETQAAAPPGAPANPTANAVPAPNKPASAAQTAQTQTAGANPKP